MPSPSLSTVFRVALSVAVVSLAFGASTQHGKQTLPHHEEIVSGVHAAGFSYRFGNANCGWVVLGDQTLLVDLPRGTPVPEFLAYVEKTTGKPAKTLALTSIWQDDAWIFPNVYDREKRQWLRR